MSGIEHEYTLNAVTGIAYYQPLKGALVILVGEGCFLKIYELSTSKRIAQCKIFESQAVHGITVRDNVDSKNGSLVAFWGARSFALLGAEAMATVISGNMISIVQSEGFAPDWIMDVALSPFLGSERCVFVTAHKATFTICSEGSSRRTELKPLSSPSQSILYSAHIVWTSPDSIMVAAGTVFGEIEVFLLRFINGNDIVNNQRLFTLTGHEGSIFGVRISPEIIGQYGRRSRLLTSCSDDRTIRVWDLSSDPDGQTQKPMPSNALARETGFGENGDISDNNLSVNKCVAMVMAHASRIWRVEFVLWEAVVIDHPTKVCILSFGEDSNCQYWSIESREAENKSASPDFRVADISELSLNKIYPVFLRHIHTFAYHSGKHIWSASLFYGQLKCKILVTGGADGKLSIYDLLPPGSDEAPDPNMVTSPKKVAYNLTDVELPPKITQSWTLDEIIQKSQINQTDLKADLQSSKGVPEDTSYDEENEQKLQLTIKKKRSYRLPVDTPNRYAFLDQDTLLITTSFGRVFLAQIGQPNNWEELKVSENARIDLFSYSLILSIPSHRVVFLAGASGVVHIYAPEKVIVEVARVSGKPAALFEISKVGEDQACVLITTLGSRSATLIFIKDFSSFVSDPKTSITVSLPPDFVVTSAGSVRGLLILGSRSGSLAIYDLLAGNDPLELILNQWTKSDDAITSIINVPSESSSGIDCHFLITSRDGSYSVFSLSAVQGPEDSITKISITLVHQAYPPLGPMIEAAWFIGTDLLLYGFRSKSFIVWNETKKFEVASVECGGAHRSYAYSSAHEKGGAGCFAYTKASKLYMHSQNKPSHTVLKAGGHGREIKACACHAGFVATGAEDTTIRIWRYHIKDGSGAETPLECCTVIEKHTTGIQHLQWCCSSEDYHNLFSAGGNEEFYVWAVSTIPGFGVGVICEATLTDHSEDHDLRIMGFHVTFFPNTTPRKVVDGVIKPRDDKYHITLIYSDSTLKTYRYNRCKGFLKIAQGTYTSSCLTQIAGLHDWKVERFFTGATDGHLCMWEYSPPDRNSKPCTTDAASNSTPTPELIPTARIKVHQSSISALDVLQLSHIGRQGDFLVATAGDDNALSVAFFHKYEIAGRITVPSAHAAGIMGLAFKEDCTGGMAEARWVQLLTVGGDQRLKRWNIQFSWSGRGQDAKLEMGLNMRIWRMQKEDDVWCSVADPGGLVRFRKENDFAKERCLVFGNGMEMFTMKDGFPNGDGFAWEGYTWERKQLVEHDEAEEELEDHLYAETSPTSNTFLLTE